MMKDENKSRAQLIREIRELRLRAEVAQSTGRQLDRLPAGPTEGTDSARVLAEAEVRFRNLVEQALVGIYIIQDEKLIFVNMKFLEIFGYTYEEIMSLPSFYELVADQDRPRVAEQLGKRLQGEVQRRPYKLRCRRKDSVLIDVEVHGSRTIYNGKPAVIGALLDITSRKKKESEFHKAQKIESLGILAGGIAHEFNNILTAINGNIILAKMYAKPGLEVYDILTEAEKACKRAEDLTRQLLTFSKGGAFFKKKISMEQLITELDSFVSAAKNMRCELSIPHSLWSVEGDEGQIRQAFGNLIVNAGEAMPAGGTIRIYADNVTVDPATFPSFKEGAYVRVSVEDHGAGIEEALVGRIFDPFFTTKERGSGLGLTSSLSIIENHDGYIVVESKAGSGATFHVYLPAFFGKAAEFSAEGRVILAGKKRVLVMDDEEMVRNVMERMLDQCGCEATFAREGHEMLEIYKEAMASGRPFDVVIVDLIIPGGMGGKEATEKLLKIDPDAKVIVSSGYSDDPIMADFRKFGFGGVLAKPYKISELSRVLRDVIAGSGA